jgi:hypothetical protein
LVPGPVKGDPSVSKTVAVKVTVVPGVTVTVSGSTSREPRLPAAAVEATIGKDSIQDRDTTSPSAAIGRRCLIRPVL